MTILGRLGPYLRPHRGPYALAVLALLCSAAAGLALPWLLRSPLDALLGGWVPLRTQGMGPFADAKGSAGSLEAALPLLVFLVLLRGALGYAQQVLGVRIAYRVMADLQRDLHRQLGRLPLSFFARHGSGEMVSRYLSDLALLGHVLSDGSRSLLLELVVLAGSSALMAGISPVLTLLFAAASLPWLAVAIWLGRRSRAAGRRLQETHQRQAALVREAASEAVLFRLWDLGRARAGLLDEAVSRGVAAATDLARSRALLSALLQGAGLLGALALVWLGARFLRQGDLGPGDLIALALYARGAFGAFTGLLSFYNFAQHAAAAGDRFFEVMDLAVEPAALPPPARDPQAPAQPIAIRNLCFAYAGQPSLFTGLNAELEGGAFHLIRGPSGGGKSTLLRLLAGLLRPQAGEIRVGGRPAAVQADDQPRQAQLQTQETAVLDASLRENLLFARPDATDLDLLAALEAAGLAELVSAGAEALDRPLGEAGHTISRGQRQRLGLARLLLADPAVILLDEPFASIDPELAEQLWGLVLVRFGGRTVILVEHRELTRPGLDHPWRLAEGRLSRDV